jgi:hypothetical protein
MSVLMKTPAVGVATAVEGAEERAYQCAGISARFRVKSGSQ